MEIILLVFGIWALISIFRGFFKEDEYYADTPRPRPGEGPLPHKKGRHYHEDGSGWVED